MGAKMMISEDALIDQLVKQGFEYISKGEDGILMKRTSTGKKICLLFTENDTDRWMTKQIHPFKPFVKKQKIYFEDLLNGDILKYI